MTITLITAGLITFIHAILMMNVGRWRGKTKINLGTGESDPLLRAVRAHANNAEHAPFLLILIALLELSESSVYLVIPLAVSSVLARALHAYGLGFTDGKVIFYRFVGTILTMLVMVVGSIAAVLKGYGIG